MIVVLFSMTIADLDEVNRLLRRHLLERGG